MTQYDRLQSQYDDWRDGLISRIEKENVRRIISNQISGSRVLDLACGSGFYTYDLMRWGAESVLGLDISTTMIEAARRHPASKEFGSKVSFIVTDVRDAGVLPGAPFDLVIGGWLLNYAPDAKSLGQMFKTIADNLKVGGCFVGTVFKPIEMDNESVSFPSCDSYEIRVVDQIEDGFKVASIGRDVVWHSFCLRSEVYEEAVASTGMEYRYVQPYLHINQTVAMSSPDLTRLPCGQPSLHYQFLVVTK